MAFPTAHSVDWSRRWVTGNLCSSWEDSWMPPRLHSIKFCQGKASFVPNIEQSTMQKQSLRYRLHFLFYFQSLNDSCSTKSFLGSHPHPGFTPTRFPWLDLYYIPFHVELSVLIHASITSDRVEIHWGRRPHIFPLPPPAYACPVPLFIFLHLLAF